MRLSQRTIWIAAVLFATSLNAQVIRTNPGFYANFVPRNDDGSSGITPLGFTINFFGKLRDSAYVNNNGNLTFDSALSTYTPFGLQKTSREIIAPYFADVDTRGLKGKVVTYGNDKVNGRNAFAANYVDVGYYAIHDDKQNRFQVVLIDRSDTGPGNFTIEFNYESITWETGDASGGVNGYGGTPATVGWSNGTTNPGTSYEVPGSMISGAFLNNGSRALVRAHLNTSQVGRLQFQARDGVISPGLTLSGGPVLPDGTVGQQYTYGFSAVGAEPGAVIQWDLVPDLLMPDGLKFSNGKIAGLPSAPGTFTFTVSASTTIEGESVTLYQRGTIIIGVPKLAIQTVCPVPQGTVGQLYSANFSTDGSIRALWTVDDRNSLPPGVNLLPSGQLTGAPSAAGFYSFVVHASATSGSLAQPAQKACNLTIVPSTVRLSSGCAMPGTTVGVPYSQTLVSDGGYAPYRFSLVGQMPLGLGLTPDGKIAGIPQYRGDGLFDIVVTDARSNAVRQSCSVGVSDPWINVSTICPLPRATTGTAYSADLNVLGGTGPYTWSVTGSLPPGLTVTSGNGITGTPMAAGAFSFRLVATDSGGQQAGQVCSLPVLNGPLAISGCPLPEATVGDSYRYTLRPAGGSQPFTWAPRGSLPQGLQMTSDGVVTGTVTTVGDFQFDVGLTDRSSIVSTPCTLKVKPLPLRFSTLGTPAPAGKIGQPYSARFSVAGGTPPYRFEFSGYLPDGITGSSDGSLTGTPAKTGTTSIGILATDARGASVQSSTSIEIGVPSLPAVRISALPTTVPAASAAVKIGVELSEAYTLPISGQVVLQLTPDTRNLAGNANQPDPHVRFSNGQLTTAFQIPAGAKRVDVPLVSTGTVATTMTASIQKLQAGGVDFTSPVTPQVFAVVAVPPVINSACFTKSDYGVQFTVLGSSTTRELNQGEVATSQLTRNTDLNGASSDYFSSDGTIRFGGAFNLQFQAETALSSSSGPFNVRLSNASGWSTVVAAQKCQ